jgi:hypothetical protein
MTPTIRKGAALEFTEAALGGPLVENDSFPAVATTLGVLIDGAGDRVGLIIVNTGANDIFVSINSNVSAANGIRLAANGGNITQNVRDDFTLPARRWYAIATGGASTAYVLELVRFTAIGPVA